MTGSVRPCFEFLFGHVCVSCFFDKIRYYPSRVSLPRSSENRCNYSLVKPAIKKLGIPLLLFKFILGNSVLRLYVRNIEIELDSDYHSFFNIIMAFVSYLFQVIYLKESITLASHTQTLVSVQLLASRAIKSNTIVKFKISGQSLNCKRERRYLQNSFPKTRRSQLSTRHLCNRSQSGLKRTTLPMRCSTRSPHS